MPQPHQPVLILGIGNILLQDEGVGVRAVQRLRGCELPVHVDIVDGGTGGADLVDVIADRRKVIVIDAMDAAVPPGTISRFAGEDLLPDPGTTVSLHQLGLVESLVMAKQLGCGPGEVVVFGIQPARIQPGLELSQPVADAMAAVVKAVIAECQTDGSC
jgi:hydrogenase maturation protease